jgi:hypothetical protein
MKYLKPFYAIAMLVFIQSSLIPSGQAHAGSPEPEDYVGRFTGQAETSSGLKPCHVKIDFGRSADGRFLRFRFDYPGLGAENAEFKYQFYGSGVDEGAELRGSIDTGGLVLTPLRGSSDGFVAMVPSTGRMISYTVTAGAIIFKQDHYCERLVRD